MIRVVLAALLCATGAQAASVSGVLTVRGAATPGAMVYLESAAGHVSRPAPAHVVMDQKDLTFVPRVLPVTAGTVVEFTNSDEIQHNVFTPSRAAGGFDLGTYSRGETRKVTMKEPGDVLVLCNIHMEMEAHILVVRDPFFAVTDRDGRFRIADVPPGRYAVKVWRRTWLTHEQTADVTDAPATVDVELR